MKTHRFLHQRPLIVKRSQTAGKNRAESQAANPVIKDTAERNRSLRILIILLPPPEAVSEDCAFKKTGKTIIKQLVSIRMMLDVTEYHADVYYNSKTGERVHAAFSSYAYRLYKCQRERKQLLCVCMCNT